MILMMNLMKKGHLSTAAIIGKLKKRRKNRGCLPLLKMFSVTKIKQN